MRYRGFYQEGIKTIADLDLAIAQSRAERAQSLMMKAKAVEHGLDPDKALPEDIMLLETDDKGRLVVMNDYKRALARAQEESRNTCRTKK
jgi:predicted transcriptional regulator